MASPADTVLPGAAPGSTSTVCLRQQSRSEGAIRTALSRALRTARGCREAAPASPASPGILRAKHNRRRLSPHGLGLQHDAENAPAAARRPCMMPQNLILATTPGHSRQVLAEARPGEAAAESAVPIKTASAPAAAARWTSAVPAMPLSATAMHSAGTRPTIFQAASMSILKVSRSRLFTPMIDAAGLQRRSSAPRRCGPRPGRPAPDRPRSAAGAGAGGPAPGR